MVVEAGHVSELVGSRLEVELVEDWQAEDEAETTLAVEGVVELHVEEVAVEVVGRHEQHTASTAAHRRADGKVDRLAGPDVVVRPRREAAGVQPVAQLPYHGAVVRAVTDEHVVLDPGRAGALQPAQVSELRVKRL